MDNLVYTYSANSNKLLKVVDSANKTYGFRDGTNTGDDYAYDANGNMTRDLNKGIGTLAANGIAYNFLNLPTEVKFDNSNTRKINYIYDATGNKLEKKVTEGSTITRTFYAGNYVYEKGNTNADVLKFLGHPEGYVDFDIDSGGLGLPPDPGGIPWDPVVPAVPDFDYVFQYRDHLGNIRLSYKDNNGSLEILEENNYYPFGLEHKGYNKSNITSSNIALKRKFGGNEHQDELGLDWYDITARNYDPALGRWMNVDPLAEQFSSWSPYNYAFNNPIRYIDPDGRMAVEHIDVEKNKDGTYTVVGGEANSDKNIYVVDGSGNRTGEVVGEMLTEYSFHHEDGSAVVGTNINLNDQSGQNFFNDEIQNIGLFEYIKNAKGTEPLDFKHRGMNDRNEGTTVSQHHYRGMSFNGKVASARDIGNYAAGYVAGKSGFGWGASRVAFDALESYQKGGFATEGQPTQQAQRAGHNVGYPIFKQQQLNRQLERAKNPWLNRSKW